MYTTLIDAPTLAQHLDDNAWIIVDCRFNLARPEIGRQAYERAHIPRAVYAHLDHDLSGPPVTDHGRHPLPTPDALRATFSRLGIDTTKQVVAYDDAGGSIAARLWWLLRYMRHEAVALLDGGWQAWRAAGLPTRSGVETNQPADFHGQPRRELLVLAHEVPHAALLVDSRAPERYRGEVEPLDPIVGHIPAAVNYPFSRNLDESGRFRPPAEIRQQLLETLGDTPPEEAVYYCGSGVTASSNILAAVHAGLPAGQLYAGSWSDWISDPDREIETGSP